MSLLKTFSVCVIVYLAIFCLSPDGFAQTGTGNTGFTLTGCIQRLLHITAYYTPQAAQGVFFNGDYETEKKINGGNVHGASGRPTYNGMLAAPKKYPFSTTVYIPGFGVGGIYDRGGAIVATDDMDRIDIWAGYGLQGMINALYRGSKYITGEICSGGLVNVSQGFDWSSNPKREDASKKLIRTLNMQQGNSGLTVGYLQSFLEQLGYLSGSPAYVPFFFDTGTKTALCNFQQQYLSLSGGNMYCGFYGTKTKSIFVELFRKSKIKLQLLPSQIMNQFVVRKPSKRILRPR